jgi:uncharacterized MAPEG superfamily protein
MPRRDPRGTGAGLLAGLAALLVAAPAAAQEAAGDPFAGVPLEGAPPLHMLVPAMLDPYAHAVAALAIWVLLMAALLVGSVVGGPRARTRSGLPVRDYSDPAYRRDRAFRNAIETSGMFVAAIVAAILAGAPPFWVNLAASVFVVARVAMAIVHVFTEIQPLRSAFWSVGALCILALALMGLVGALL